MPDDIASTLAGIRERYTASFTTLPGYSATLSGSEWTHVNSADDVPLLLAAIEAVLAKAGDWDTETSRLDGLAEAQADPQSRITVSMRAQAFEECARTLREAITTALTGKEAGDGATE